MLKTLRVVDLAGKNPGTRRLGVALSETVLGSKVSVILDFTDVVLMNSAFCESLFSALASKLSEEELRKRVAWKNLASKEDELSIERVIAEVRRQQASHE